MINTEQLRKAIEECVQKRPSGQSVVFTSKFVEALARELLANREAPPVAWTDAEELHDLEKDGCGAMLSLEKCKGGDPRRQILLFTHPALETELQAVVERLNASGYEYENGPVTTRNASAVVEIVLQQLDDAVQERGIQPAPAVPEVSGE